jgi:hypothetical protein
VVEDKDTLLQRYRTARQDLLEAIDGFTDAHASANPRRLEASHYGASSVASTHEQEHTEWIRRWRSEEGF